MKENCLNSRTSGNIDMKLGPVTNLNKRNKKISEDFDEDSMLANCDVIVTSLSFLQFLANLEQSGSRVLHS